MMRGMTRLVILFCCLELPFFAQGLTPDWVGELTTGPAGASRNVPPCEIQYTLGWNNWITAGKASLSVREAGGFWRADATAASTGFARTLWKYDCEMSSIIHRTGLRAHFLQHSETDSEETCCYRVAFGGHQVVTFGPMDDLLSVILHARSLELRNGQKITRVVQPWDKPYLTTFHVLGRETLAFGGKKHPCIKIGLQIRKIDRASLVLSAYKKMKTATIWVSDDDLRVPVEMHADIFIGYISARMSGMKLLSGGDAKASLPGNMTVKPPAK
jgi:hypothetical protein